MAGAAIAETAMKSPEPHSKKAFDTEKWNALLQYDDDLREAAETIRPLGDKWADELARAYLILNDKRYLPNIVTKIGAAARAELERAPKSRAIESLVAAAREELERVPKVLKEGIYKGRKWRTYSNGVLEQEELSIPENNSAIWSNPTSWLWTCLLLLGFIIVLFIVLPRMHSLSPEERDSDMTFLACLASQDAVKSKLRTPATADFPSCDTSSIDEYHIRVNKSRNTFVIRGYVDAEDALGGKSRNQYEVTLLRTGSDASQSQFTATSVQLVKVE
jgi:hypothetical protein